MWRGGEDNKSYLFELDYSNPRTISSETRAQGIEPELGGANDALMEE
jgi:hypothetical protein